MPVGLQQNSNVYPVAGIRLASVYAGLRKTGVEDVLLMEVSAGSSVAVSLTQNLFSAAPISIVKEHIKQESPRYLIINAGNANAGTGEKGLLNAKHYCRFLAERTSVPEQAVLPFSTGVIGQQLEPEKIISVALTLLQKLSANAWDQAACAIMTTDTVPKIVSRQIQAQSGTITITGIAKGAGMICPDMATMLAFIATDADIAHKDLEALHKKLTDISFNRISVDGDTSTNDACVAIATAQAEPLQPGSDLWKQFEQAALEVYQCLAQAIIRDGEGASKFVIINVNDGDNEADCEVVARAIAHSPLVKTALYASDANWGRILAAVGRAGVALDINCVDMTINNVLVLKNGQLAESYTEETGSAAFAKDEIKINISLGCGNASYTIWTTDLSHDYVRINAEYRT